MHNLRAARVGALAAMFGLMAACASSPGSLSSAPSSSAPAASASSTPPASAPAPSVAIAKGKSAKGLPGCSSASCAYVLVTTRNFSGSYTCTWWGSDGGNWASTVYTGDKADARYAYYGFPDTQVHVTCGGVRSNTIKW